MRLSVSKGLRTAMVTVVVMLSSNSVSGDSNNIGYYIGGSGNSFRIDTNAALRDLNGNLAINARTKERLKPVDSEDKGFAIGLTAGVFLNDRNRINFSHFSGDGGDSSILSISSTSVSIDHSFNNLGVHRGLFLGAGIARVGIETEAVTLGTSTVTGASSTSGTGLLLRAGFEYQFDNQLFLDTGLNLYPFDLDVKSEYPTNSALEWNLSFDVSHSYISLNYAF